MLVLAACVSAILAIKGDTGAAFFLMLGACAFSILAPRA